MVVGTSCVYCVGLSNNPLRRKIHQIMKGLCFGFIIYIMYVPYSRSTVMLSIVDTYLTSDVILQIVDTFG